MNIRNKILNIIANLVVKKTWLCSIFLIILTIYFSILASKLEISPSVVDMLPKGDKKANAFELIIKEFNNSSNIIVVLEGEENNLKQFSEYIKPRLLEYEYIIDRVDDKIPTDFILNNSLKLFSKTELKNFSELFKNPNLIPFLINLNDSFEKEFINEDGLETKDDEESAIRFLDGIEKFIFYKNEAIIKGYSAGLAKSAVDAITIGEEYFLNIEKNMMLIMIEPKFNMFDDISLVVDAVNTIDNIIQKSSKKFNINAGLTGTMVLQRDELEAIKNDSFMITLIAFIFIFLLFVISFRMWFGPLLSIITVTVGIIWSLGISSFLVDNLNLLTSMISLVLVGLAIDFSIHIISTFTEFKNQGLSDQEAMNLALFKSGPGISTGAFSTGIAFFTMFFSNNKGMSELGLVASIGIIITMIATMLILPNLLIIREKILRKFNIKHKPIHNTYKILGVIANKVNKNKIFFSPFIIIFTVILLYNAMNIQFDYNILNLEPIGLESINYQEKMHESFDIASDYMLFTSSTIDSIRSLTKKIKGMNTAGRVESIIDYLPNEESQSDVFHFIREIRRSINSVELKKNISDYEFETYLEEINRLEFNLIELQDLSYIGLQDKVYKKCKRLVGEAGDSISTGILSKYSQLLNKDQDIQYQLSIFQQNFSKIFKDRIEKMSNFKPLNIKLLPDQIKNRFISKNEDIYLVTVYPNQIVWEDMNYLFEFNKESESISETSTGMPAIMVSYMNMMIDDGKNSTFYALFAILLLLLVDMKNIKLSFISMIPLVFGLIWMLGIMSLLNLKLNMMNVVAIPLIIGIGIDDGIHIIHRYIIEKNIKVVYSSTGRAVLLTTITTMLAFGSLWFSTYRGLGSLGIALFIGCFTCFFATLFVIPTLLKK